jgi:hypothetical protein
MHQTRYLYYTENLRYPVFSTSETMWVNYRKDTTWHRSAAVNESVQSGRVNEPTVWQPASTERKDYVHNVFPNPFRDDFKVNFALDEKTNVAIELYSFDGLKLGDICSKRALEQGVYEFEHKAPSLPSGTYFVKFIFNDHAFVKQTIKIR